MSSRIQTLIGVFACAAHVSALLSATAFGQTRAFMDAAGNAGAGQPTTGHTIIGMARGSCQAIEVWLVDADPGGTPLTSYQLIFQMASIPEPGATGLVTYVDNNPGAGGGDSIHIDTTRPDWAFFDSIAVPPPVYNETLASNIFGVIYNTAIPADDADLYAEFGGAPAYLAEFVVCVSADACGPHRYVWNVGETGGQPPFSAFFYPSSAGYHGGDQYPEFQHLLIEVGPLNDRCTNAIDLSGSDNITQPFTTTCGTVDGPQDCATGADIWYTYTAPNVCQQGLDVTVTSGDAVVHEDTACVPVSGGTCNPDPLATGGATNLIQIIGDDISGTLHIETGPAHDGMPCDDGDPCTFDEVCDNGSCAGGTIIDCSRFDDMCHIGACNSATGVCEAQVVPGNPCNDGDACTADDVCSPDGTCNGRPLIGCTDGAVVPALDGRGMLWLVLILLGGVIVSCGAPRSRRRSDGMR